LDIYIFGSLKADADLKRKLGNFQHPLFERYAKFEGFFPIKPPSI
jgi:hypothetical protein